MKRERDEAVGGERWPIGAGAGWISKERILRVQRALETVARTSEVYAVDVMSTKMRDMDRVYVQGLAAKEAAKEPDGPSKVNWNWFCGAVTQTELGCRCPIKHVGGRKVIQDVRRDGADSEHTWNKVVLLLSLADNYTSP